MKFAAFLLLTLAGCASGPRQLPGCEGPPVAIGSIADPFMPVEVYDDGVQTYMRFAPNAELPAVYVATGDPEKPEALVNKHPRDDGGFVFDRVAERWVLRRGTKVACLVNDSFSGGAERLPTGTVIPGLERVMRTAP